LAFRAAGCEFVNSNAFDSNSVTSAQLDMATMMSLNVLPARAVRLSARRAVSAGECWE
jgi:methionine synthase I (cobalamin-dependent)